MAIYIKALDGVREVMRRRRNAELGSMIHCLQYSCATTVDIVKRIFGRILTFMHEQSRNEKEQQSIAK